jgi:energy-coupling factor transporter transmembrane protein EcfT
VLVVVVVIAIVALSCAAGLAARRWLRTDSDVVASAEGLGAGEMWTPVRILVSLVLAFVLVQTFSSYQDAGDAATKEAGAVSVEASSAALLPMGAAADLVGALRCYARAVAGPGWTELEVSRHTSPISDQAAAVVEAAVGRAQAAGVDSVLLSEIYSADRARVEARRVRLGEAEPSVPGVVTVLLVLCVAVTIGGTATLAHRRMRAGLRYGLIGITAVVFTATLLVIFDLDRPFGGIASIKPTEMRIVEGQLGTSPLGANPPCDALGRPPSR